MGKNLDKLGKIDDYQAPWESATGEDKDIDNGKLKKFLFGLLRDKATAQDARDEALEKVTAAETERDEAKSELEKGGAADLQKELEKERAKTSQVEGERDAAVRVNIAREVAEEAGLTLDQAGFLTGNTKEELEASAEKLVETFGITKPGEGEDEGEDNPSLLVTQPRTPGKNPADPNNRNGKFSQEPDYEAVALGRRNRTF